MTEGADIEECRSMLRDALREMVLAYQELGQRALQTGGSGTQILKAYRENRGVIIRERGMTSRQ